MNAKQIGLAWAMLFGLLNAPPIHAQSTPTIGGPLPSFEVASVRQNRSGDSRAEVYFRAGGFTAKNATAKALIAYAYNVKDFQISGGPGWMDSDRYDVGAKEEDTTAEKLQKLPWVQYRGQVDLLVQTLLADRFQLRVIHQAKQSPVYALVVAKNGSKLSRSTLETMQSVIGGHRGHLVAKATSMAQLADVLSWLPKVGVRKVVDQTGLSGNFDFSLDWMPDPSPAENASLPTSSAPSLFTALQEQLGLKLESTKGPVEVLVIDHIERPSEN